MEKEILVESQLDPSRPAFTLGSVPIARRTYFLEGKLGWRTEGPAEQVLSEAAKVVLLWFDSKISGELPDEIRALESGVLDHLGLETLYVVGRVDEGIWAGRLRYADKARGSQAAVAGRTWTAEVSLRVQGAEVWFGIQMFVATRPGVDQTVQYDRPELIPMLATEVGLESPLRIVAAAPELSAQALLAIVEDPNRRRDVVVLTKAHESVLGFPYTVDKGELSRQLLGIATVVALTPDETFEWTNIVGREWTVFGGAVRVYKPKISWEEDDHFQHPLKFPSHIQDWSFLGKFGESAFRSFLVIQCTKDLCDASFAPTRDLTFARISEEDFERRRDRANDAELLPLAEEQILNQRRQIKELEARIEGLSLDLAVQEDALESEKQKTRLLIAQSDHYLDVLKGKAIGTSVLEYPTDIEKIGEWCEQSFPGRIQLMPRAVRSLKDGSYSDPSLIARCLEALALEGRNWLLGQTGGKALFESKCQALGVWLRKSITETRAGEEEAAYFVPYPRLGDRKRLLEWHIGKGNDRDSRNCLRIYFFGDTDSELVIIGHLPDHLPIRSSN